MPVEARRRRVRSYAESSFGGRIRLERGRRTVAEEEETASCATSIRESSGPLSRARPDERLAKTLELLDRSRADNSGRRSDSRTFAASRAICSSGQSLVAYRPCRAFLYRLKGARDARSANPFAPIASKTRRRAQPARGASKRSRSRRSHSRRWWPGASGCGCDPVQTFDSLADTALRRSTVAEKPRERARAKRPVGPSQLRSFSSRSGFVVASVADKRWASHSAAPTEDASHWCCTSAPLRHRSA